MAKFDIGFNYTTQGQITVEAESEEEAEKVAQKQLNDLRDAGSMNEYHEEISWSGDEVEVL